MKNLIKLVVVFTILYSCEKEATLKKATLKPSIDTTVTFVASTSLPPDTYGVYPSGLTFEYQQADSIVYDTCKYVAKAFRNHAKTGERCYIRAESEHWVEVMVLLDRKSGVDTLGYNKGYQVAEIDFIY